MALSGKKVDVHRSESKGSAEDFDHSCEPCLVIGQFVEAHGFCVDCQEYLCKTCFACHQRTKASKHHQLLDKRSICNQSIHSKDSAICNEKCQIHKNEIIKFFCTNHEFLGCTDCITVSHRTCTVDYIPDKCVGIGDSDEYKETINELEQQMEDMNAMFIKATMQDRAIDSSYDHVIKEIVKFRKEINDRLDQLQMQIQTEADRKKLKDKEKLRNVLDTCAVVSADIKKFKTILQDSKDSQQNGQLYVAMKQAKSKLKLVDLNDALESLEHTSLHYVFERNSLLKDLIVQQDMFGKLSRSSSHMSNIGDIYVQTTTDKSNCWITGCAVMSRNKIILVDNNNYSLKVVNTQNEEVIREKTLESKPWSICVLPQKHIAVTMPDQKKILVMTTGSEISIIRRIPVKGKCRGLAYHQGQDHLYVVCVGPNCLFAVDTQGRVMNMISLENEIFASPNYILINKDAGHIYINDCSSRSIVALTIQGDIIAVYKDKDLREPVGMAMLDDGAILVCYYTCNGTIQLISRDLKRGQTVLDGLQYPQSIFYSRMEQKVFIGGLCNQLKIKKLVKKK